MTISITYILLLTYFLHGGSIVTHGVVSHSELDCKTAMPLIIQLETDRSTIVIGPKRFKIDFIDGQCIRVPQQHLI